MTSRDLGGGEVQDRVELGKVDGGSASGGEGGEGNGPREKLEVG